MPGVSRSRRRPCADDVLVLGEDQRARPDEAHLAAQHVEELRQLVDRPAAQEAAERRHPRVVRDLEHPRAVLGVLVQVRDLGLPLLGVARTIVRNLKIWKRRPPAPIRSWRKNTGPRASRA